MPRPVAIDHAEKRNAILAAAVQQIADHGVDGTSMSMIAAGAGVSKAGLYHYYDSKEAIIEQLLTGFLDNLLTATADPATDNTTDGDRSAPLRALVVAVLGVCTSRPGTATLFQLSIHLSGPARRQITERQRRFDSRVEAAVVRACPDLDKSPTERNALVQSLYGILHWQHHWWHPGETCTVEDLGSLLTDLLLGGAPEVIRRRKPDRTPETPVTGS